MATLSSLALNFATKTAAETMREQKENGQEKNGDSSSEPPLRFPCSVSRVWDGGLEDVQHAVTNLVPGLG